MEKEKLRRVEYSYANLNDYEFAETIDQDDDVNENYRKRDGYFHDWTNKEIQSPESGDYSTVKVALIEDAETGEVYEINSENIIFK